MNEKTVDLFVDIAAGTYSLTQFGGNFYYWFLDSSRLSEQKDVVQDYALLFSVLKGILIWYKDVSRKQDSEEEKAEEIPIALNTYNTVYHKKPIPLIRMFINKQIA